jgi:ATP-binding cassette subfamily F protein 3
VALVSHDRHFLGSLVNRVFAIDHGQMQVFDGSYDDYLEKTAREQRAA